MQLNLKQQRLLTAINEGDAEIAIEIIYQMSLAELGSFENWITDQGRGAEWCGVVWGSGLEVSASFEILWAAEYLKPVGEREPSVELPARENLNFDDPICNHQCFLPHDLANGAALIGGGR